MLVNKGVPLSPVLWSLLPAHIEFVLFGWTLQLVMGMGFWILPRFSNPPLRGNEGLAWGAFFLLNAGIGTVVLASFWLGGIWLTLALRAAVAAGVILFSGHAWPRVKGFGNSWRKVFRSGVLPLSGLCRTRPEFNPISFRVKQIGYFGPPELLYRGWAQSHVYQLVVDGSYIRHLQTHRDPFTTAALN